MLEQIVAELFARGVLPSADLDRYVCAFSNRANINILVFDKTSRECFVFLKVSNRRDLAGAFSLLQDVYRLTGDCVPEPMCCFELHGYQVLATRAYRLGLLAANRRLGFRQQRAVVDQVMNHLALLHSATRLGVIHVDSEYLNRVIDPMAERLFHRWRDPSSLDLLRTYLHEVVERQSLVIPKIPQHGDLGGFNTALVNGSADRILIIDWDSYGAVTLAGLDVITFVASLAKLFGHGLYQPSRISRYLAGAATDYADRTKMPVEALGLLYPVYWLFYASLRDGVGVMAGQKAAHREVRRFLARREDLLFTV